MFVVGAALVIASIFLYGYKGPILNKYQYSRVNNDEINPDKK